MRMRRILAGTATVVMVAGGVSLTSAPAASATDLSPGCERANIAGFQGLYGTTSTITHPGFFAGETIVVSAAEPTSVGTPTEFRVYLGNGPAFNVTAALSASISYTFLVDDADAYAGWQTVSYGNATWTVSCSIIAEAAPIPAWVQAVGRASADAACDTGWDTSWQEWAVPVTGGWVCTRSIPSLG